MFTGEDKADYEPRKPAFMSVVDESDISAWEKMLRLQGSLKGKALQSNVLDNITGDTPALQWSELKSRWPHLEQVPFASVAGRAPIDVLIGSDHRVFHRVLREICGSNQNDPVAWLTNLGLGLLWPYPDESRRPTSCACIAPAMLPTKRQSPAEVLGLENVRDQRNCWTVHDTRREIHAQESQTNAPVERWKITRSSFLKITTWPDSSSRTCMSDLATAQELSIC